MLDFEIYEVLVTESIYSAVFTLVGVLIVVLIVSGSVIAALLVLYCVLFVDLCLLALVPLWGLTFNNVVVVHMLASVALSALYSLFVTIDFILVEAPRHLTKSEQRKVKARLAVSQTSSSVLHGIVASLLALMILGLNQNSYYLAVFARIWFGTVLFGSLSSFLLVPTILSFFGPVVDSEEKMV